MHSSFSALRAMLTEQNVALQRHDAAHLKTSLAALASSRCESSRLLHPHTIPTAHDSPLYSAKLKGRIGESLAFAGEMVRPCLHLDTRSRTPQTSKMEDTRLQGREQAEIDKQRLTALSEFLRKHAAESGKATGADEAQR